MNFDPQTGRMEIRGRSILENPFQFYQPVFDWLENYLHDPQPEIHLQIQLEYFNSGTSKCLLELLRQLEGAFEAQKTQVRIDWYYEPDDDSIFEAGEDFQLITGLPIELVEYNSSDQ